MSRAILFTILVAMASTPAYAAAINITGSSADWSVVMEGGQFDPGNDLQANNKDADIVGDATHATMWMSYDDKADADATNDEVGFRIRLGGANQADSFGAYLWIGIDVDLDNDLDVFLRIFGDGQSFDTVNETAQNKLFDGQAEILSAGSGDNTSPDSTTADTSNITTVASYVYNVDINNTIAFAPVTTTLDPNTTVTDLDGDGVDQFLSFKLNFEALKNAVNAIQTDNGVFPTIDKDTSLQFTLSTSTNSNNVNSDVGGYDDKLDDTSIVFSDKGAFSPPLSFSNIFPEITSNGGADTAAIAINEATTDVTTVIATDADGDTVTFSISSEVSVANEDKAKFSIDTNSGDLIFVTAPDASAPTDVGGDNNYQVIVVAGDGNSGTDTQAVTITVNADATPPAAPSVDLLASSDTGVSDADDTTSDTTPTIRVTLDQSGTAATIAVVGDVVILFENGIQVGTAILAIGDISIGHVDITSSVLSASNLSFTATVTDVNSNTSAPSGVLAVSLDFSAPLVDITSTDIANIINSATYPVSGTCTVGDGNVTVAITGATPASQSVACSGLGEWSVSFDVIAIGDGNNVINVDANQTDTAGNTGSATTALFDKDVLIATPTVDALITNNVTPTVSGTAEVNSIVVVSVAGATFNTFANGSGVWSVDTSSPSSGIFAPDLNGSNSVLVSSTDAAGNLATDVTANELVIDTTSPSVPTVTSQITNDTTPVITGTWDDATAANLSVTVNGVTYERGIDIELTSTGGNWTLDLSAITLAAGTYGVVVSAADAAGNTSADATTNELIIDVTAPVVPTVNSLTTDDTTPVITGTWDDATAASLSVTVNGVTYELGTDTELTNIGGNWTLDLSAITLTAGTYGVVVSTADTAGNVSGDATINELIIIGAVSAANTTISVSAASVIADGLTTSTITVQAKDVNGNNLIASGGTVTLASTGSGFISSPVVDNNNGTYTATISNLVTETVAITGIIDGSAIADDASVAFTDVTRPVITLTGEPSITIERGLGYFEVGATAFDNTDDDITVNIVMVNPVDADTLGIYTVTFDVSDAAGNPALQVTRTVIVEDATAPGVSIVNQPASVNNLDAFTVTFQFTEIVSGFDSSDIKFTNSTLSNFVNVGGIGDTYKADIKPDGVADVSVGVDADAAQDASANGNTAAVTQITVFDSTPPDVVVTSSPGVNLANQSSYPVSGTCTVGDGNVTVFLGIGSAFFAPVVNCIAGGTWSSTFDLSGFDDTAVSGLKVEVFAWQTDSAGNKGTAVTVEAVKDTVKPNVQIQNIPAFVNGNEFTIRIVFDEDVTGFDSGDIAATNGAVNLASFNAVDARTYEVGVIANGAGDVTLNVAANVAQDLVGNDNNAATPVVAVFDDTAPVVTITNAAVVNAANDANYTIGGDCDNGDGVVTASIAGAMPATQDVNCTADNWTAVFDVTLISDGLNALTVNASQTDAAANTGNAIAVQVDKDVLITVPTVTPLVTNNATPVITGTADTGTSNEIVVGGATYTVSAVAGDLWSLDTAAVTPDSGTFSLAGGVNEVVVTSTDAAGNSAIDASSNELTLTLDDDNDGIPNAVECPSGPPFDNSCTDSDGDGTPDFQEVDSDNDGIPDANEAGNDGNNPIDSDGDGIPDYRDTDSDNDGIDDAVEGVVDTDGDNIPDYVDVGDTGDSDGDGIPDTFECPVYPGCTDTDGDGKPDYLDTDADNDGIDDAIEAGVDPTDPIDTDGDGVRDYLDTDSDQDGVDDVTEGLNDNDGDGIPDYVDASSAGPAPNAGDSDGDGIADNIECELYPLCADSDNDGTPDYMEADSDGDGIPDVNEAGSALNDADNDGIDDIFDIDITSLINGIDQNGDGIDDTQPLDTDGDGTPDYQDADSDGDGIDDIVECPAGIPCPDADNDGIPDQLDASDGDASGTDITGSGDSDGDGISDFDECVTGVPCSDIDQDGLPDYMDNNPDDGPAGDPDNDAILNYLDPDDDNDGIPDVVEDPDFDADNNPATNPLDSDLDGIPDYLDLDSDNDGLTDADESGASGNDSDGDNIDDSYDIDLTGGADLNADGIDDDVTPRDTDGDSLPDYLDTVFDGASGTADTDNDGIPDDVECPVFPTDCPDSDNDGTPDFLETDSDGDGLGDDEETGSLSSGILLDTDGDGVPDYQDTDSDNDGISDAIEGLTADSDADGIPDALDADSSGAPFGGDSDGDGVVDMDECNSYPDCADSNNDGTPDYMDSSFRPYDPNAQISTALNGVGSNGPWVLLLLPATLLIRRKIR